MRLSTGPVAHARKRQRFRADGTALSHPCLPNDLWCADFKGEFILFVCARIGSAMAGILTRLPRSGPKAVE